MNQHRKDQLLVAVCVTALVGSLGLLVYWWFIDPRPVPIGFYQYLSEGK
jgi:hypothetical protein